MHQRIKGLFLAALFFFAAFSVPALTAAEDPLQLQAASAILVEGKTGKILYEKNPEAVLAVGSMSKMFTEYLVLSAIKEGKITWETTTVISDYAWRISQNLRLSNVPLRKNTPYTVRELYEAAAIYSANGATIALAELLAGSEGDFLRLANNKAKELGLKDTTLVNSTGLDNSDLMGMHPAGIDPEATNLMTVKDLALLAFHLLRDHPEVITVSRIPRKIFREGTPDAVRMDNWNWMLPELVYAYPGVDGLKTGYTDQAGYCFTATAERNRRRLISVVMRSDSYQTRFAETRKLLDHGFNRFDEVQLVPAGFDENGQMTLPVRNGKKETVTVTPAEPLRVLLKPEEKENYEAVFQPVRQLPENRGLQAPLAKGEVAGYLVPAVKEGRARENVRAYEYLTAEGREQDRVPVLTTESVAKAGWFTLTLRRIRAFFVNLWQRFFSPEKEREALLRFLPHLPAVAAGAPAAAGGEVMAQDNHFSKKDRSFSFGCTPMIFSTA
ncbi:MAG: D-alanyl-D-alanine carboxypeptidase [Firmicutes bacterium]|nr:D-alanyl-D-alanine carboxypeptidase [Bacillota bacterium]